MWARFPIVVSHMYVNYYALIDVRSQKHDFQRLTLSAADKSLTRGYDNVIYFVRFASITFIVGKVVRYTINYVDPREKASPAGVTRRVK